MKQKRMVLLIFSGLAGIYLILAYKNPFSNRSLIPNLEPYPDSLYYSFPAWSWLHGTGWGMNFHGESIPAIVPPGYTWWLLPFIAGFNDVRGFYVANLVLQLATLGFLLASVGQLHKGKIKLLLMAFAGWILVSNFYFYNLPSLLMAENITIAAVAISMYLLTGNITFSKSVAAGLIGVLLFLIKLSNVPIGVGFWVAYGLKMWRQKELSAVVKFAGLAAVLSVSYYFGYFRGSVTSAPDSTSGMQAFSSDYFGKNLQFYGRALLGGETRYLWYQEKLMSPLFSGLLIGGLVVGILSRKWRFIGLAAGLITTCLIGFMCFFYYPDSRYILGLLPGLILVMTMAIAFLLEKNIWLGVGTMVVMIVWQLGLPAFNERLGETKIVSLKKQIGLNFRHREDPWNYNAVVHINNYLVDKPNAYIGTLLPPFYVEMFRRGNYQFLPISSSQEFSGRNRPLIDRMYQADGSIEGLYARLIREGKLVYVTNAYVNNSPAWTADLETLKQKFNASLVSQGCMGSCNIYQLRL